MRLGRSCSRHESWQRNQASGLRRPLGRRHNSRHVDFEGVRIRCCVVNAQVRRVVRGFQTVNYYRVPQGTNEKIMFTHRRLSDFLLGPELAGVG